MFAVLSLWLAAPLLTQAPDWAAQAREARQAGDFLRAAAAYSELLKQSPDNPVLLTNLGIVENLAGEHAAAVKTLEAALKQRPDLVPAHLFLGLSLVETGRAGDALAHLDEAARADPKGPLPRIGLARARLRLGEIRAANDEYAAVTAIDPRNAEAWLGLGETHKRLLATTAQRVFAANADRATLDRILAAEPFPSTRPEMAEAEKASALPALVRLARAHQALGVAALRRVVALLPGSVDAHLSLAEMYIAADRIDDASSEYNAALRLDPNHVPALLGLAGMYWMSARNGEAEVPLKRVLELAPDNAVANGIMAEILSHAGRDEAAKPYMEKALRANPDLVPVRAALARVHLAENRPEMAVSEIRKALDADLDGSYHYLLAHALQQLGRAGEAEQALEQFRRRRELWRMRH